MFFLTKSILYCYCDIFYLEIVAYDIFYFQIVPCDILYFEIVPRLSPSNIRNYHYLWNIFVTIFTIFATPVVSKKYLMIMKKT